MHFKTYSYLPRKLKLQLNFKERKQVIEFDEPTLYNLMIAEQYMNEWKINKFFEILWIKIKETDFLSNPNEIIKSIFKLCYVIDEKKSNENWEWSFLPAIYDFLANRYWVTPISLLKEMTPSILNTYIAWLDYNKNIENNKKQENYKYKERDKISDTEMKKYDEIMERVNKSLEKKEKWI